MSRAGAASGEEERLFQAAFSQGSFDIRGTLGQRWQQEKARKQDLAVAYKACGKGYAAQREFRQQWLRKHYTATQESRRKTHRLTESDDTNGVYEPMSVVVQKEGNDKAAIVVAKNYVDKALEFHRRGMSLNGHPIE